MSMNYRDRIIRLLKNNEKLFAAVISRYRNFEESIFKAEVDFPWDKTLWSRFVIKKTIRDYNELATTDFPNKYSELLYSFDVDYSRKYTGVDYQKKNIKYESLDPYSSERRIKSFDLNQIGENKKISTEFVNKFHEIINEEAWTSISKSKYLDWNLKFIEEHIHKLSTENLLNNSSIGWTSEMLSKYLNIYLRNDYSKDHFFRVLSDSTSIDWNEDIIDAFNKMINWTLLSRNPSVDFTEKLLNKYKQRWNWSYFFINKNFPWSFKILRNFKSYVDWEEAPYINHFISPKLYWTDELIDEFENKIDFSQLGKSDNVEFGYSVLNKVIQNTSGHDLSSNHGIEWTKDLIEKHSEFWDWSSLITNKTINWSKDLILYFNDNIEWNGRIVYGSQARHRYNPAPISTNPYVEIDIELLRTKARGWKSGNVYIRFTERPRQPGEWHYYSKNKFITTEIIDEFAEKLDWAVLRNNNLMNWKLSILEKHSDKFNSAFNNYWLDAVYNDKLWKDIFENVIDEKLISQVYSLLKRVKHKKISTRK
jgi:hypothetical protein